MMQCSKDWLGIRNSTKKLREYLIKAINYGPIPYRSQLQIYMLTTEAANYKDSKPKATEEITHCIHQLKV